MGVLKRLRRFFERLKDFLPIIEGRRVYFTKDALIFLFAAFCAVMTALYILGIRVGSMF